jgi:hypothetical protein
MTTLAAPIDDSLAGAVALAGAGDETAFARIIAAHHDDMTRVCFVICGDLDVAERLVRSVAVADGARTLRLYGDPTLMKAMPGWFRTVRQSVGSTSRMSAAVSHS